MENIETVKLKNNILYRLRLTYEIQNVNNKQNYNELTCLNNFFLLFSFLYSFYGWVLI